MVRRVLEDHPGVSASPSDRDILQRISIYLPATKDVAARISSPPP